MRATCSRAAASQLCRGVSDRVIRDGLSGQAMSPSNNCSLDPLACWLRKMVVGRRLCAHNSGVFSRVYLQASRAAYRIRTRLSRSAETDSLIKCGSESNCGPIPDSLVHSDCAIITSVIASADVANSTRSKQLRRMLSLRVVKSCFTAALVTGLGRPSGYTRISSSSRYHDR